VETGHSLVKYLIHAPTMRTPKCVQYTENAYLAMKAILKAVMDHNKTNPTNPIRVVLCSGLCTFYGKMDPDVAAGQMLAAYNNALSPPKWIDWEFASERENQVSLLTRKCLCQQTAPKATPHNFLLYILKNVVVINNDRCIVPLYYWLY
jgi:hypothetical protein